MNQKMLESTLTIVSLVVTLFTAQSSFAIRNDLDKGSPQNRVILYEDMTPAGIQKTIREEIAKFCNPNTGLCRIFGIEQIIKPSWEFTASAGTGPQSEGQNVYYINGSPTQSSTSAGSSGVFNVGIKYKGQRECVTNVMVDVATYRMWKSYAYGNIRPDGTTPREMTDSELQAMMFFGRLIDKVSNCSNGNN
jgi:hypothetical protein